MPHDPPTYNGRHPTSGLCTQQWLSGIHHMRRSGILLLLVRLTEQCVLTIRNHIGMPY